MPYASNAELPERVRNVLPEHAQDIYRAAFNSAYAQYGERDDLAARVAWAAVKRRFAKDASGQWTARP
jgi:cation transport regulator